MRFIALNTWTSDESGYDADCDLALVVAGAQEVKEWLEKIALATKLKEEHDIDAVAWYDRAPYFLSTADADLPMAVTDAIGDVGVRVIDRTYSPGALSDMEQRMDTVRAFVDKDGVYWEGRPKHTSISVGTAEITKEFLEKLQRGET